MASFTHRSNMPVALWISHRCAFYTRDNLKSNARAKWLYSLFANSEKIKTKSKTATSEKRTWKYSGLETTTVLQKYFAWLTSNSSIFLVICSRSTFQFLFFGPQIKVALALDIDFKFIFDFHYLFAVVTVAAAAAYTISGSNIAVAATDQSIK